MAPPDPPLDLARRREGRQIDRLRVVDEDDVRFEVEPLGVLAVHFVVQVEVALPQCDRLPLQAVVEGLGDAVEVGRAGDHFPAGVDAQLLHQRHHPAENLGHAAADPRRVDVDDPLAGQPLAQPAEPLDFLVADDLFVAV